MSEDALHLISNSKKTIMHNNPPRKKEGSAQTEPAKAAITGEELTSTNIEGKEKPWPGGGS